MKASEKKKEVLTAFELATAQNLFLKLKSLKEQMKTVQKDFSVLEMEVFRKVDKGAGIEENAPLFTIKEFTKKVIAWEAEMTKLCGEDVVSAIKETAKERHYRRLEF